MLTGLAIGLAGALGLTQFMAGLLYGVGSRDPSSFLGTAGLLMEALRYEWQWASVASDR
jgi:hypothetical protein